nr:hypothetical protein Iba_chr12aCG4740 [Ipomoea batatas]GMD70035.1 hypothetical protein Iba_chr12eCG2420 [Ipomoea batatas]
MKYGWLSGFKLWVSLCVFGLVRDPLDRIYMTECDDSELKFTWTFILATPLGLVDSVCGMENVNGNDTIAFARSEILNVWDSSEITRGGQMIPVNLFFLVFLHL